MQLKCEISYCSKYSLQFAIVRTRAVAVGVRLEEVHHARADVVASLLVPRQRGIVELPVRALAERDIVDVAPLDVDGQAGLDVEEALEREVVDRGVL
jgi:hypothetical protein